MEAGGSIHPPNVILEASTDGSWWKLSLRANSDTFHVLLWSFYQLPWKEMRIRVRDRVNVRWA